MPDYDDIICPFCQHIGVLPDGGFDWVCPECGYEGSLNDEEYEEDDIESIFDDDGFSSQGWNDDEY